MMDIEMKKGSTKDKRWNDNLTSVLQEVFQEGLENIFKGRNEALRSHWGMYFKSGLMRWFRKALKRKYTIPKLGYDKDFTIYNDFDDIYGFGSDWLVEKELEKSFRNEIFEIMKLLYLPENAYYKLFIYFLYRKVSDGYPLYNFADVIAGAIHNDMPEFEQLGYTRGEIKTITNFFELYLKDNITKVLSSQLGKKEKETRVNLLKASSATILGSLEKYRILKRRQVQKIKELDLNIKILKSLQHYGSYEVFYDYSFRRNTKLKLTSCVLSQRVYSDLEEVPGAKLSSRFRKQAQRLLEKYPFLKDCKYPVIQ